MLADDRAVSEVVKAVDQDLPAQPLFTRNHAQDEGIEVPLLHGKGIDRKGVLRERVASAPASPPVVRGGGKAMRPLSVQVPQQVPAGADLPIASGMAPSPELTQPLGDGRSPAASVGSRWRSGSSRDRRAGSRGFGSVARTDSLVPAGIMHHRMAHLGSAHARGCGGINPRASTARPASHSAGKWRNSSLEQVEESGVA